MPDPWEQMFDRQERADSAKNDRIAELADEVGRLQARGRELVAQRDELANALVIVLKSARPHPIQHPAMTAAWEIGKAALRNAGRLP